MDIKTAIAQVVQGDDLDQKSMQSLMNSIMQGELTAAQIGGLLVGLRMKGEAVSEIAGAAQAMRALASKVTVETQCLVDTCGTGGDGMNTFNISTTAAFVAAAAGATVAKHGNRSISSQSGSADVLEKVGVNVMLNAEQVADCINTIGIGFMFAPLHHEAMKHVLSPRRELAIRTLFNLLGPLANPANAAHQLIGVFAQQWLAPMAHTLQSLGSVHAMIVHAEDGLDEISIATQTQVAELKDNHIEHYHISPEDFGMTIQSIEPILVANVDQSMQIMQSVLADTAGVARDITVLNAGATIYVAGVADTLAQGVELADSVIHSGAAMDKLKQLIDHSNHFVA